MDESDRKALREVLFEVIENQMNANNPPETRETYRRLRAAGFSKKETMKMLACAVVGEIYGVLKENRTFDEAGYIKALKALPQLAGEGEPDDCA